MPLLPWIIFYFGGRDLYLYVLVGFALIMMFLNPRELLVKRRTGEKPQSKELRKTDLSEDTRAAAS